MTISQLLKFKVQGVIMIYKFINSQQLRFQRAVLNCLLIISYLTTFSSCMTTEISYISPNSLGTESFEDITKIELKNGILIDCRDKLMKIERKTDSTGIIIMQSEDTVKEGSNVYAYKYQWNQVRIPVSDVLRVHLDDSKMDVPLTALVVLGALVVIGIVLLVIWLPKSGRRIL